MYAVIPTDFASFTSAVFQPLVHKGFFNRLPRAPMKWKPSGHRRPVLNQPQSVLIRKGVFPGGAGALRAGATRGPAVMRAEEAE